MNANLERIWADHGPNEGCQKQGSSNGGLSRVARARHIFRLWLWRVSNASTQGTSRLLDIVGACIAGVLLLPVIALTWLAIRLEDGGPAIYVQQRVGRDGVVFPLLKFRSMVVNAERLQGGLAAKNESGAGVLFKMKHDPRITRVGALIRKLSLDELPQLLNVLRGEMSLVGPRPALPKEVAQYSQAERARLSVRPGITCLWQIGGRSDIDFRGQVQLDMRYIRERSFITDVLILAKTIPAVLSARGAY